MYAHPSLPSKIRRMCVPVYTGLQGGAAVSCLVFSTTPGAGYSPSNYGDGWGCRTPRGEDCSESRARARA
jgi:hypothetical protein